MYHWTRTFFEDYPQHYRCVHELSRRTNVHRPREPLMDERLTIFILGWSIGAVVAILFVLDAIALAG
jgi:hypothetical protein